MYCVIIYHKTLKRSILNIPPTMNLTTTMMNDNALWPKVMQYVTSYAQKLLHCMLFFSSRPVGKAFLPFKLVHIFNLSKFMDLL